MKVIEKSDAKIVMRVNTKCVNVPYCDTFNVEEEFIFASPTPNAPGGLVKVSA
jgi:transposase-like protein